MVRLIYGCDDHGKVSTGEALTQAENDTVFERVQVWRGHLMGISWFINYCNQ